MDDNYSIFCINLKDKVSLLANRAILPTWLAKSNDFIFDAIQDNLDKLREDDKSLFEFIYANIVDYCYVYTLNQARFEFTLHLRDGDKFIAYKFLVFVMNDNELYGGITKDGYEEIFDRSQLTKPVSTYHDFKDFVTHMVDTYDEVALVQLDINNFKSVNMKYGEDKGDEILKYFKDFLTIQVGSEGKVIHQTGDIFTMVLKSYSPDVLTEAIQILDEQLSTYENVTLRLSWGIYHIEKSVKSVRQMIDNVTIARKSIKGNVLYNIGIYHKYQQEQVAKIQAIEDEMFKALANREFKMFIQPKFDMKQGSVIGGEALIRWIKPDGQIIPPDQFIPIFESDNFVIKTDRFIWEEACKFISEWQTLGNKPVPLSVNISRKHLSNTDFIDYIDKLVAKYKIDKHYLQLEITESLSIPLHKELLQELKRRGYTLLMDDFGSGYSSLSTLQASDFDVIKLDKEFLSFFMNSDKGKKIIGHIISMINDIELDVIAEGVETEEQAKFLGLNGCYMAQGFLYAKPLTVQEFKELLLHDSQKRMNF